MVNDVAGEGVGIDADTNAATFLTRPRPIELPEMPKRQLADRILDEIIDAPPAAIPVMLEMDEGQDPAPESAGRQERVLEESVIAAARGAS